MKYTLQTAAILACLALAACATPSVVPAAVAPTQPTAPAPLPTPMPGPGEINNPADLGIGAEFTAICRSCVQQYFPAGLEYAAGLKELKSATHPSGVLPWFRFPIRSFFGFTNGGTVYVNAENPQFVVGNSVNLKDGERQAEFDELFISQFLPAMQETLLEQTSDVSQLPPFAVGDESVGITAQPTVNGFAWRLDAVSFRSGDVGAFVFVVYPAEADAPVDVTRLAQLYAESLGQ